MKKSPNKDKDNSQDNHQDESRAELRQSESGDHRRMKLRNKMMLYLLPFMVSGFVLMIFLGYTMTERTFLKDYESDKLQAKEQVTSAVKLIGSSFSMLDSYLEDDMERACRQFQQLYQQSGGNPDKVNLDYFHEKIGEEFDFAIIDKATTIVKSTMKEGLGFNFRAFDPKLGEEINQMRLANSVRHEQMRTNVGTGFLSKFAYIPSQDHRYLLEVIYEQRNNSSSVKTMDPLKITAQLAKTNPNIVKIRIFDVYGYEFVNSGKNYKPTKESLDLVKHAIAKKEYKLVDGNLEKSILFINLRDPRKGMTDNSKVVEIVFDKTFIYKELERIAILTFSIGSAAILIMAGWIIYLSRRLTKPITLLSNSARRVAKGDYNTVAINMGNDEIGGLVDVFNSMTARIKANFEKIELQKEELEDYSKNLEQKVIDRTMELNEERELLKATLLSISDGVISTDKLGRIQMVNDMAETLTAWRQEEVLGRPFNEIFHIELEHDRSQCKDPIESVISTGMDIKMEVPVILIDRNGMERPIECSAAPIEDEAGEINGVVLIFRDYTEKKEKLEQIEYLCMHDQLTGLYNRRFLEEELKRIDTIENLPITLVMVDVNGLKLINDAFGHQMGDQILQTASHIIRAESRSGDIVSRIGGDEFLILLPRTSVEEANAMMKRIRIAMEQNVTDSISMSVSYGISTKKLENEKINDVFKLAEDHMYRRKLTESKSMHYKTIEIILKTLHEKSIREKLHSERVSQISKAIGRAMGLKGEAIKDLTMTGLMHDIGKIAIDLSILDKPSGLTQEEQTDIQRHPELGYQILRSINEFARIAEYVLSHHEQWDGSGYPRMLTGDEIPVVSRIIAIADAYDAMTSDRPYRKALSHENAVAELMRYAGTQFDPELVRLFVEKQLGANGSFEI